MSKKTVVVGSVLVWFIPCLAGENPAMYSFALKNEVSLRRIVCDWINQDGLVLSRLTLDSPHSLSRLTRLLCLDLLQIVTLRYAKVLIDIREIHSVIWGWMSVRNRMLSKSCTWTSRSVLLQVIVTSFNHALYSLFVILYIPLSSFTCCRVQFRWSIHKSHDIGGKLASKLRWVCTKFIQVISFPISLEMISRTTVRHTVHFSKADH